MIIDSNDRLVSGRNPDYWPMNGPSSYPAKRVVIWISKNEHKELWAEANNDRPNEKLSPRNEALLEGFKLPS